MFCDYFCVLTIEKQIQNRNVEGLTLSIWSYESDQIRKWDFNIKTMLQDIDLIVYERGL